MLPGKSYELEDLLEIGRRHKWVVLVPFALLSVATIVGSQYLPNRYHQRPIVIQRSTAMTMGARRAVRTPTAPIAIPAAAP